MSSFSFGAEYGNDQISAGSDYYINYDEVNYLSQINKIKNKEDRIYKKINKLSECPRSGKIIDYCKNSVYANDGSGREITRQAIIDDIENQYLSGREPVKSCNPVPIEKLNAMPIVMQSNAVPFRQSQRKPISESFDDADRFNELEKNNTMLMYLVLFLVVIIMVQYSKSEKMHIVMVPTPAIPAP